LVASPADFDEGNMDPAAPIRLMVVDDHPVVRSGVAALAAADGGVKVVAQACNGAEAIDCFRLHRPDVTLMDLQMPVLDGTTAIKRICGEWPGARIVVLTTYQGDVQALRAMKAGACGYLLKSMIRKEMSSAIQAAHNGRRYMPPEVANAIAAHATDEPLSPREIEVLQHLALSSRNKLIAESLGLSEGTVKTHMKSILSKLEARDRTEAVMIALRRGIISLES
jgi:DNA-binding NarL/FixJ family response regulator